MGRWIRRDSSFRKLLESDSLLRPPITPNILDSKFLPGDNVECLCFNPEPADKVWQQRAAAVLEEKSNVKAWPFRSHYVLSCTWVPCLKAVTSLSSRGLPWLLSLVSTRRFYKRFLIALTFSTIFYTCHSLKFVYSEIMRRVTLCLEQHLMDMFPEPSPNKNSLRKESLNLGMCVQLWVVAWLTVLPLICEPFLGAVTNSIAIISGLQENCVQRRYLWFINLKMPSIWNQYVSSNYTGRNSPLSFC